MFGSWIRWLRSSRLTSFLRLHGSRFPSRRAARAAWCSLHRPATNPASLRDELPRLNLIRLLHQSKCPRQAGIQEHTAADTRTPLHPKNNEGPPKRPLTRWLWLSVVRHRLPLEHRLLLAVAHLQVAVVHLQHEGAQGGGVDVVPTGGRIVRGTVGLPASVRLLGFE
jgi:hypothetical protein